MLTKKELTNTYIKYSEDITEEIFNRVVDKLINKYGYSWYDKDTSYKDFIRFEYLKINPYGDETIRMYHVTDEKPITVQDILGEDWDKPKFEVGKCYYANWNWSNIGKIAFKVTKNIDPDYVNFSGFYNLKRKLWIDGTSILLKELSDIQEISLEEIQQYLPADYVDKIKEFKLPEKWKIKEETKPISKWGEGTYVVFCKDGDHNQKIGTIDIITEFVHKDSVILKNYSCLAATVREKDGEIKWFATLQKAEEFSKSLLEPKKDFDPDEITEESKQENMDKVAVSLPTQEKWDFFISKFNPRKLSKTLWKREHFVVIKHSDKDYVGTQTDDKDGLTSHNYKIITFEEWLKDNNYASPEHKDFQAIEISEFKVGDRIEIVNSVKNYFNWGTAFKAIKFRNTSQNKCSDRDTGTIFHICKHPNYNINLISINLDNGNQCLIDMFGIKKISEYIPKEGDYIRYLGTKCGKIDDAWKEYFGKYGIKKYDVGKIKKVFSPGHYFIQEDGRSNTNYGYLTKEDFTIITKEEYLKDRPFNGKAKKIPEIGDVRGSEGLLTKVQLDKLDKSITFFDTKGLELKIGSIIDNSILPSPTIKEVKQSDKTFEFTKQTKSYRFINNKKQKSYVKKEFKFSRCDSSIQVR